MRATRRRYSWIPLLLAVSIVDPAASDRGVRNPANVVASSRVTEPAPRAASGPPRAPESALQSSNLEPRIAAHGVEVLASVRGREARPVASLRLVALGRADALSAVGPGTVVSGEGRVEIRRPGIVEWFAERSEGLEQGFTIDASPPGTGSLRLELDVRPALAIASGPSVRLVTSHGQSLSYAKLRVADATGMAIPARFEVVGSSRVRLVVDERGATYPIVVDPILTSAVDTTLVSDQDSSLFGYSVASAGDVNGDGFDDVIVGAYEYDIVDDGERNGAAFIFHGGPTGIPSLSASGAATRIGGSTRNQFLGVSVASAGDVNGDGFDDVIVGAGYTNGEEGEGAAFIFHGRPGGIPNGAVPNTILEGNQVNGGLGYSVASAGDVNGDGKDDVIVGAPGYDPDVLGDAIVDAGAAFVFLGSPTGVASAGADAAAAELKSLQPGSVFGFSVASAGDVNGDSKDDVIVGARLFSSGQLEEGAAFIFHGGPNGVADASTSTAATMLESDDPGGQLFDVASAGDLDDDGFDDVIVGIPAYGPTDAGRAVVYMGSPSGVASGGAGSGVPLVYPQNYASFGTRAASAGDLNGDGYGDLVIGMSRFDGGQPGEGAVIIFLCRPNPDPGTGFYTLSYFQLEVNDALATLGTSVATAGDVNRDGFADVIAGAPYHGPTDRGAAFIWTGGDGVDSDGDRLMDGSEIRVHGTDPNDADSDDDLLNDFEEIEGGSNPLSATDPPLQAAPLSIDDRALSASSPVVRFKVDMATLPARPLMTAIGQTDPGHPDMNFQVAISHCNFPIHPTTSPPRDVEFCPRATNPVVSTGQGTLTTPFHPWLCQVDPQQPHYVGMSCFVTVRALDFGTVGPPATFDLSVTGITEVPTATVEEQFVAPQVPVERQIDNGTQQPYFSEAQNFRWTYDEAPLDDVVTTSLEGQCTYRRSDAPTANALPYTYSFQGDPAYVGPDCCSWQITSTTGVTGTGQVITWIGTSATTLTDVDGDGVKDVCDNCVTKPNGPFIGSCLYGPRKDLVCRSNQDCLGSLCGMAQQDADQDGRGDVCPVPEPSIAGSLVVGSVLIRALARSRRIRPLPKHVDRRQY